VVLAIKRPLFVRLIEMSLQIPSGQERRWEIKNHVCGIGCFKDFDFYRVTRSRLTAVKKRELNGVTISAVESAGSHAWGHDSRVAQAARATQTHQLSIRHFCDLKPELLNVELLKAVVIGDLALVIFRGRREAGES